MVAQIINPARQEKKLIMKQMGLKTGKQYRKWIKKERRIKRDDKEGTVEGSI